MAKIINGNNSDNLKSTSRLVISFSEQTISIRLCTKSQTDQLIIQSTTDGSRRTKNKFTSVANPVNAADVQSWWW